MSDASINRREFVARAGAAGVALAGGSALLDACGAKRPAAAGELEGELNIYNWSDYIAPGVVAEFEKEFGVRVTYDTYESNEELIAKLMSGATGYDLVVPSGYALPVLRAQKLLAPVDRALLPNWENVAPLFRDPAADPGNAYTVPWQWGVTGLAYRRDRVAEPPASWSVLFEERYRRQMTMLDDGREVLGAMLKYRGHSLNSTVPAELERAKADALRVKPNLKAYVSAPVKAQLVAGDVWIAQLWNGDAEQAAAEEPQIAFAVPAEGSLIWVDYLAIPRSAPHPKAAHAFMNYILRGPVGARIADHTGYGSPNQAAAPLMKRPVPYPDPAALARLEYQTDLGPATELWDRLWTEVKAG